MKNYNYQNLSGEKPERKYDIQIHTFRVLGTLLNLDVQLNESLKTLDIYASSRILNLDSVSGGNNYYSFTVLYTNHTSYSLSSYRVENLANSEISGFINLVSNSSLETMNFTLSKSANLNMEIFNTLGQCIMNTPVQNASNYSVNDLLPGVYFAVINDAESTIARQKFVIR